MKPQAQTTRPRTASPPRPAPPPPLGRLPASLTFFLTASQRAGVLRALSALDRDRAAALLKALGLNERGTQR